MDRQALVHEFHEKFGFSTGQCALEPETREDDYILDQTENSLSNASKCLMARIARVQKRGSPIDTRVMRAQLMVEELGEIVSALRRCNPIDLADGLADLSYVVDGTAVTYGFPLDQLVREVHESNMSKDVHPEGGNKKHKPVKGADYLPPNIKVILRTYGHSDALEHWRTLPGGESL